VYWCGSSPTSNCVGHLIRGSEVGQVPVASVEKARSTNTLLSFHAAMQWDEMDQASWLLLVVVLDKRLYVAVYMLLGKNL